MTGQETASDVIGAVLIASALFGGSLIPFFLLIEEKHLTPLWLRRAAARAWLVLLLACDTARIAVIDALLFLLRLAAPKGANR
ncbi:hypothetical protein AB0I66_21355 [Streptomyces sp. NPDC050439]|uniref:hypothetical protein n=1 Tax=unclassified Streptomyces TaxID=2593676 RepID=UPI003434143D